MWRTRAKACTNREVCTVYENRTDTPLQALNLMNDVTYLEASRKLAERMLIEGGKTTEQQIAYGYELLLARPPRPAEQKIMLQAFSDFQATYQRDPAAAQRFLSYGQSARRTGLAPARLAALANIASLLLNSDATINKE
jgi:Protein of unknown function (DUF1553)